MRIVACPDKFKGTATASEVAHAIQAAAVSLDMDCDVVPLADGGEGTLAALGGANRTSTVTGPLGTPVEAAWRLAEDAAVIEMAEASGLVKAGGRDANDPLAATTRGVGELILEAVEGGATSIVVGVGGSATTDGGLGALEAIGSPTKLAGVTVRVACDVRTVFEDAASIFGPQKGASSTQVELLRRRLQRLAGDYQTEYGVDVAAMERSGAAGGLAGGLAAFGATLVDGFEVVANTVGLDEQLEGAQLAITGEGFLDEESFAGKVVGGVHARAKAQGVPVVVIAGQVFDGMGERTRAVSLTNAFGLERALNDTLTCVADATHLVLSKAGSS